TADAIRELEGTDFDNLATRLTQAWQGLDWLPIDVRAHYSNKGTPQNLLRAMSGITAVVRFGVSASAISSEQAPKVLKDPPFKKTRPTHEAVAECLRLGSSALTGNVSETDLGFSLASRARRPA
ncbi:hypothetical protein FALBO_10378, partial [Fusarium albosuccineum]